MTATPSSAPQAKSGARLRPLSLIMTGLLCGLFSALAQAQDDASQQAVSAGNHIGIAEREPELYRLCRPRYRPDDLMPLLDDPQLPFGIQMEADQVNFTDNQQTVLTGNVTARRGEQQLGADHVTYDEVNSTAQARGNVTYLDRALHLRAEHADVDVADRSAQLDTVNFELLRGRGRGQASAAHLNSDDTTDLEDLVYTTCEEGDEVWRMTASSMHLNHEEGTGRARDMKLYFGSVPVFYLPYATFPLDDRRKSGVLFPSIGYGDEGIDIAVPYYFNIAPNQDATLTPRFIGDRGVLVRGEYRFLHPSNAGELFVEYINNDDLIDDQRGLFSFKHRARLNDNWTTNVDLGYVSDQEYFSDLGDSLSVAARPYLRSTAQVIGRGSLWTFIAEADAHQTLDRTVPNQREPYRRLPRLLFDGELPGQVGGLDLRLQAETVNFDRDVGDTGTRLDLYPTVSYPILEPGWYVTPTVGVRYTSYDLDRDDPSLDDSPDRTNAIFNVDGGLIFEREISWGDRPMLQTLEPRFFYLYVSNEEQDDLPIFDTTENTFSFGQLFRINRFAGADRMNDANQLSLAVTSRTLDDRTGREILNATIGQIYYFRDQEVQLPNRPAEDRDRSPFIAEVTWRPLSSWTAALGLHWDPEEDRSERRIVALQKLFPNNGVLNIAYRFQRESIEQADFSFVWPLNQNWNLVGRWLYDLGSERSVEQMAGFEYDTCCWAARLVARQFVRDIDGTRNDGIYLQFLFKGLGSVGNRADRVLKHGILGYTPVE